jgi:L-lysine 2,3-aminomutase
MITQTEPITIATRSTPQWKTELREAITDIRQLERVLGIDGLIVDSDPSTGFPLRVPMAFVERMQPGNSRDPLLLQVLPLAAEKLQAPGFVEHPLEEARFNPVPGVIHKYHGRVLLITTPVCAVHCRYCFRRHFPYQDNNPGKSQWLESLRYISTRSDITEVILSGGDPLACDDRHLAWLVSELDSIPHVKRLRIHTRLPVVIPSRIDDNLLRWLNHTRLQPSFVVHINHSNEINDTLAVALNRVRSSGAVVLNQSVLLRDINDSVDELCRLSEKLFGMGVIPYYLHALDPVSGAGHFDVSDTAVIDIYRQMQAKLPGYLVPRLVRDIPGQPAKVPIGTQLT